MNQAMDRFIVVGGCGFLGSSIVTRLRLRGLSVLSVHRSPVHRDSDPGSCLSMDFKDTRSMTAILNGADVLIHLGSQSVPRTSIHLGVPGILSEVEANSRLFDAAAKAGVRRIVFASSGGSVYGECAPGVPVSEGHRCEPISPHGLLKAMTELALSHLALTEGLDAVSLRPGNIYGPGQRAQKGFGVIPTFNFNLMNGIKSEIWGPESVRDYIHVEDAADVFVKVALSSTPVPRTLNVGTGVGHTAVQVYSILQELLGIRVPVEVMPRPAADPVWSVLDIAELGRSVGIAPKITLREGLSDLVSSRSASPEESSRSRLELPDAHPPRC